MIRIFFSFLLLTSCASFIVSPKPNFQWPLKKYTLTQKFAPKKNVSHQGLDLQALTGRPIFSSHSGRVVYAGNRLTAYGKTVIIEFSSEWASLYAHLQNINVKLGQKVSQGEKIGTLGNTGKTSGPHLHFELIYKKQVVNPLSYLP